MEIPQNVQDKLKCSECDELLSCGPVYSLHETGGTICGRCCKKSQESDSNENSARTRNEPYEATASLLAFPCAHAARGCPEKVQFSLGRPANELSCKFRPFICPVEPRGSCDWIGSWPNLEQHFQEKHPSNILENPCSLPRPDLTKSSLFNYLVSAFHFLFLLHVKVCTTSGKLFHSVQMFGDSKYDTFSYLLEITDNGTKVMNESSVLRPERMVLEEPTANCILINNLLGVLGGKYNELKFAITIRISMTVNCMNCLKEFVNVSGSEFCCECREKLVKCEFNENSCLFVDVKKIKCYKHEQFFCIYQTKCLFCAGNFDYGSFIEHLSSSTSRHKTTKANINSVVRITRNTSSSYDFILFSSDNIGTILCQYKLSVSIFRIWLNTSLPSFELNNFKCSIELTDPQTRKMLISTSPIDYNNMFDWYINVKVNGFESLEKIGIGK